MDGRVLWANLHLLFWLSLFPFGTAWMGETGFASVPVAVYGVVLLSAALAYYVLVRALIRRTGRDRTSPRRSATTRRARSRRSSMRSRSRSPFVAPWISFACSWPSP